MENEGNSENTFFDDVAEGVMSDSDFFEDLEQSANGAIYDDGAIDSTEDTTNKVTPEVQPPPMAEEVNEDSAISGGIDWDSDSNPYKKRYSDSSREAQNLKTKVDDDAQYSAIIDVMKQDPALIDKVRSHINGEQPKNIREALNVPEDFVFDADEAFSDPNSPSAKLFNAAVDSKVQGQIAASEQKVVNSIANEKAEAANKADAERWMNDNKMSSDDFTTMMDKASNHKISYDDINLILNGANVKKNVAKQAKSSVTKQMANARKNAPPTASHTGSVNTGDISEDDRIFDALKNLDEGNNLFDS